MIWQVTETSRKLIINFARSIFFVHRFDNADLGIVKNKGFKTSISVMIRPFLSAIF